MIKDIEDGIVSTIRTAWYTAIDLPWAGIGASLGALAVGFGGGVGVVGPLSQIADYMAGNPDLEFTQKAIKGGVYIGGTVGALFGATLVNNGTTRQAASMSGAFARYNPTEQELKEREVGEMASTLIATAAAPTTIYYYDIANKVIERSFN